MAYKKTLVPVAGAKQVFINIEVVKGDSVRDPSFVTWDNQLVDLTGTTALMQVRDPRNGNALVYTFSPIITVDGSGILNVALAEHVIDLPPGTYKYDIQFTYPVNGDIDTPFTGSLIVTKEYSYA